MSKQLFAGDARGDTAAGEPVHRRVTANNAQPQRLLHE